MDILPSIDLRDGAVVRLARGDYDLQTTYSDDPVSVAHKFVDAGTRWIHVVDLDAARTGELKNFDLVRDLVQSVDARIELGGGARSAEVIERMLEAGVARVVVGSGALRDWDWFEQLVQQGDMDGKIALGLDARQGKLAADGWTQQTDLNATHIAARTRGWDLGAIIYTDIARDGMLEGVDLEITSRIVQTTDVAVIASGGVTSLADVEGCKRIGCEGAIIGRAYYEGRIDLAEAIRIAEK